MSAITSYTALKAAVADWLVRDDQAARIPVYVGMAEAQLNALRLRQMVKRATAAITDEYSALPPDFLEEVSVTLGGKELLPAPPAVLAAQERVSPAQPRYYGLVGAQIRYLPAPDAEYTAELTYYARIPALADDNPTNWLLAEAPDAYLYGALIQAAPYLIDGDAANTWANLYAAAIERLKSGQRTKVGPLRTEIPAVLPQRTFNIFTGA